jgi:hypothetical protein
MRNIREVLRLSGVEHLSTRSIAALNRDCRAGPSAAIWNGHAKSGSPLTPGRCPPISTLSCALTVDGEKLFLDFAGDKIQIVDPDVADQQNLPRADHWNSPGLSSRIGRSRSSTSASSRPGRRGIELGRALATAAHLARHTGTRGHAKTLRTDTVSAFAPVGLRLFETKTRIVQIDGGSGVLGFYMMHRRLEVDRARLRRGQSNLHYENMSSWPERLVVPPASLHLDMGEELDPSPIFDWRPVYGW